LGVLPSENEIVPKCLAKTVTPTSEVTGDFLVCLFSVEKEGRMQMVCVQSVGELRPIGTRNPMLLQTMMLNTS
jgi:hypothetical protein